MQDTEACPWRQRASVEPSPVLPTLALEVPGWGWCPGLWSLATCSVEGEPSLHPRWSQSGSLFLMVWRPETKTRNTDASSAALCCVIRASLRL